MYMFLRGLYLSCFLLSLIMLIFYYESDKIKTNKTVLFFFITTVITNYGHSLTIFTETPLTMLAGNQISSLGYIFATYFFLVIIYEICNVHFSIKIRIPLMIYAFIISALLITAEHHNYVYKSFDTLEFDGIQILHLENGSLHSLFSIYLLTIDAIAYYVVITSILSKKIISKQTLKYLFITLLLGSSIYITTDILGADFSLIPAVYVLIDAFLLRVSRRISLYDISSSLINSYKEKENVGYITFDKKYRFMCCDSFILKVFPELNTAMVDKEIPRNIVFFQKKVIVPLKHWNGDISREYVLDHQNYHLVFTINKIISSNKTVGYLLAFRDQTSQLNKFQKMDDYNRVLQQEVRKAEDNFMKIQDNVMEGMAIMIERRDNSTGNHIKRTSACVRIFMEELAQHSEFDWCTPEFCEKMIKAAPLHDLGKIAVDDAILRKPGRYEPEERKKMEVHSKEGGEIVHEVFKSLNDTDFRDLAENVAHYHHEKWNGTGYPDQKKGKEIPIEARIMALADVFDALVSKRCYKDPIEINEAFLIIDENLSTHFDPELGKIFLNCKEKLREYYYNEEFYNPENF